MLEVIGMLNKARRRRIIQFAVLIFGLLLLIVLARTASLKSRQPSVSSIHALESRNPDTKMLAQKLSLAVQKKTISESRQNPPALEELKALHAHLEASFPKVHEKLEREVIGERSLLFTWKTLSQEKPIILCAHQDVVPIDPGTEDKWSKPPFAGEIDDKFVWGRGTLDDKDSLIAILEAVETLIEDHFIPRRPLILAFGHDEEISGKQGADKIIDQLVARQVHAEAVLDEGNPVTLGVVPSIKAPVAPIGIAEKGYLTLKLTVELPGGHSSTPKPESALGVMNSAIEKLRAKPFPARLDGATAQFFEWAAPEMSFGQRMVLANTWLTWPIVSRTFAKSAALDASVRTTTAVTVFKSGVKDNVVPGVAEATVNFRVLPGDTTEFVIAQVRATIDDARVKIEPDDDTRKEPSKISSTESRLFQAIGTSVKKVWGSEAVVTPALFLGATDGRHYEKVADDVYRFSPVLMTTEDIARLHGNNERVEIEALGRATKFYRALLLSMLQ